MRLFILLLLFSFSLNCHEHNSTINFPVGILGKEWEFESDHLPVGLSVEGVHIACWNVLDTDYLEWIENDAQGLNESAIMRDNIPCGRITLRERKVLDRIKCLFCHPTHPRAVVALEEVNESFFAAMKNELPSCISSHTLFSEDVFLYNRHLFDFVSLEGDYYSGRKGNSWTILTLKLKATGQKFVFVQSHVPGGENSARCRKELAEAIAIHFNPQAITVIMGDQNRSPDYFEKDLSQVGLTFKTIAIPYPTHVNTMRQASWIDNLFIAGSENVEVSTPDTFYPDLPLDTLWSHFPEYEKVKEVRAQLAQYDNASLLKLYDELVYAWRYAYLETEGRFPLGKVLDAVEFAATKHHGQFYNGSTLYLQNLLIRCRTIWSQKKIHDANRIIAILLEDTFAAE